MEALLLSGLEGVLGDSGEVWIGVGDGYTWTSGLGPEDRFLSKAASNKVWYGLVVR